MHSPSFGSHRTQLLNIFRPYDIFSITFLLSLSFLILIFHKSLDNWYAYALGHVGLVAFIVMVAILTDRIRSKSLLFARDIYSFLLLFFLFEEMERFTRLIFPEWKNHILICADHFIFGVHPTVWLEKMYSIPLTEFLELVYLSYYILLPVAGFLIYFLTRREIFEGTLASVALAFYICFIGYILLPAEGPWKTLAHLQSFNLNNSFFHKMVAVVQGHGGIVGGCFPSAHVSVVFAVVTSFFYFIRKVFYWLLPYSLLLSFATVYGRYHYAVDSLAGILIGIVAGISARKIIMYWNRTIRSGKEEL